MNDVAISVVIGLLVVGRFLQRELRERRFVVARIYLLPAIAGAVAIGLAAYAVIKRPETAGVLAAASVVAIVLGAAIGYAVAHRTTVRVTADASVLYARGSLTTVAIWVGAVACRLLARVAFVSDPARAVHFGDALNAALLVLLASALFFVRYRMLVASRLERTRGVTSASPAI